MFSSASGNCAEGFMTPNIKKKVKKWFCSSFGDVTTIMNLLMNSIFFSEN